MTHPDYQRVQDLFFRACELPRAERSSFLDEACGDATEIRRKVEQMLQADEQADGLQADDLGEARAALLGHVDTARATETVGNENRTAFVPSIDGFTILDGLGEGGMGVVWRATQHSTRREVALKTLTAGQFGSERERSRFAREVELLAALDHPNIAQIFESGETDGVCWYAMELVDGSDLESYVGEHQLATRQILALLATICEAVHHAHQRGVLHRDLKPANILVDREGCPHILDFGLARAVEQDATRMSMSIEGQIMGTPAFMSPEQASGSTNVQISSDIYSLGVILYRLLTENEPHDLEGGYLTVIRRIAEQEIRPPRQFAPSLDRDIEAILLHALAKDPGDRYPSAGEMGQDLRCFLGGEPIRARASTFWYVSGKWLRKHRLPAAIFVCIAATAMIAAVGYVLSIRAERARTEFARKEAERSAYDARRMATRTSFQHALSLCDGGDIPRGLLHLAFALRQLPPGADDLESAVRANLGAWPEYVWQIQTAIDHGQPTSEIRFSRDGTLLAIANDSEAQVRDAQTGALVGGPFRHRLFGRDFHVWSIDISPDNQRLAMSTSGGVAKVFDIESGKLELTLPHATIDPAKPKSVDAVSGEQFLQALIGLPTEPRDAANVWVVRFSPHSPVLLTGGGDRKARLWDSQSGKLLGKALDHGDSVTSAEFSPQGDVVATVCRDGKLRFWDSAIQRLIGEPMQAGKNWLQSVSFDSTGQRVLTTSHDGTTSEWDVAKRQRVGDPIQESTSVWKAAYAPGDRNILTVSGTGRLRSWIRTAHEPLDAGHRHRFVNSKSLAVDSESGRVAVGDAVGTVWITRPGRSLAREKMVHNLRVSDARFGASEKIAWTVSNTAQLVGWDLRQEPPQIEHREDIGSRIFSMALDQNRTRILLGTEEGVAIFDVATRALVPTRISHRATFQRHSRINCVAWTGDGSRIVTGGEDKTARVWVDEDGKEQFRMQHEQPVRAMVFSADGEQLHTASGTNLFSWSMATGDPLGQPWTHPAEVNCVALDPATGLLLTGCSDGIVRVCSPGLGSRPMCRDDSAIHALALVPSRDLLVTGSGNGVVRCWDLRSGMRVGPAMVHDEPITNLTISNDGGTVMSSSVDRTVRTWDINWEVESAPLDNIEQNLEQMTHLTIDEDGNVGRSRGLAKH